MPEMRKCKECGKMFTPKGREQYCSDTHYRPCPVCGTPVVAKYLSDPPRKCDKCRGKKEFASFPPTRSLFKFTLNKPTSAYPFKPADSKLTEVKQNDEHNDKIDVSMFANRKIPDTIDPQAFCEKYSETVFVFIGKECINSFIPGHKYLVNIQKDDYSYSVSSSEDVTVDDTVDIVRPYSSQLSFHQSFVEVK